MLNTELGFPKRLFQLNEHLQEVEEEAMAKTVELEKQLSEANTELEQLKVQQHGLLSTLSYPGALCTALSLPLSLSFCLSLSVSLSLSLSLFLSPSISLFLSVCLSLCLPSMFVCVRFSVFRSICKVCMYVVCVA